MSEFRVVGQRVRKPDGRAKVTGQSRYFDDLSAPEMLYARVVRSTRPHAQVTSVDVSAALASQGVLAVLSGDNLDEMVGEVRSFDPACHDFARSGRFVTQPGDSLGPVRGSV
jgi:CO/xanthine dehydrogenase Mo-binding subunit